MMTMDTGTTHTGTTTIISTWHLLMDMVWAWATRFGEILMPIETPDTGIHFHQTTTAAL
jgi:hypothetical protein